MIFKFALNSLTRISYFIKLKKIVVLCHIISSFEPCTRKNTEVKVEIYCA